MPQNILPIGSLTSESSNPRWLAHYYSHPQMERSMPLDSIQYIFQWISVRRHRDLRSNSMNKLARAMGLALNVLSEFAEEIARNFSKEVAEMSDHNVATVVTRFLATYWNPIFQFDCDAIIAAYKKNTFDQIHVSSPNIRLLSGSHRNWASSFFMRVWPNLVRTPSNQYIHRHDDNTKIIRTFEINTFSLNRMDNTFVNTLK